MNQMKAEEIQLIMDWIDKCVVDPIPMVNIEGETDINTSEDMIKYIEEKSGLDYEDPEKWS